MNKKKLLSAALLGLLAVFVLAGCGSNSLTHVKQTPGSHSIRHAKQTPISGIVTNKE